MGRICLECGSLLTPDSNLCPKDETHVVEPPEEALLGTTIAGRYHILSIIGRGGMGVVYKARQIQVDRFVAVKMLHAHVAADPQGLKRFQHEAKACGALQHPNLVQVHDSGVVDEARPYLVMSYEEGESLSQILEKEGVLAPQRAINMFMQVCDGLAHAHHKGIVHRDLKPGNILLTNSDMGPDFVKVVDFGIAKLLGPMGSETQSITKTGETFGSPWYMSPEQCVAQTLDARSDVYALGCVMYHALVGKPPLVGESAFETMTFHVSKKPLPFRNVRPDLKIMPELEKAVFQALEKVPEERWQSMMELKQKLRRVSQGVAGVSVPSMPIPPPPPPAKEVERPAIPVPKINVNPRVVALVIAVLLLLLAVVLQSIGK